MLATCTLTDNVSQRICGKPTTDMVTWTDASSLRKVAVLACSEHARQLMTSMGQTPPVRTTL